MTRSTISATCHTRRSSHSTWPKATRQLACEPLERRELLAIDLSGVQTVGIWGMGVQSDILCQTQAQFTITGSAEHAGEQVTVNWGDGSDVYQGVLDGAATASTIHTYARGTFTATVTCGEDVNNYNYHSSSIAVGQITAAGILTPGQGLFVMGNASANYVSVSTTADGAIHAATRNPSDQRTVYDTLAGIYGDLLGGADTVSIASSVTLSTYFCLGDGADIFRGGSGADTVLGGQGADTIFGGGGADVLMGGDGNDSLWGNAGDDCIDGGAGNDAIYGGAGNDVLLGNEGKDTISGEAGNDLLEGDNGNDRLFGGAGNDSLYGSAGNDTLDGAGGDDWLFGEQGRDTLLGGAGNDALIGGADADQLSGGPGNDVLAGGYDFLLNLRCRDALDSILAAWAVQGQIPHELSDDANLKIWNDAAVDRMTDLSGRNLFYAASGDKTYGRFSRSDVKVVTPAPTGSDVATIDYPTPSGIGNPSGSVGRTTTILGRYYADMDAIINQKLLCRNTIDLGSRERGFQVLNVPNALNLTSDQFWTEYNQPFLSQAVWRNDVIMAATGPSSGGGYGRERDYLVSLGYEYDSVSHLFVRS